VGEEARSPRGIRKLRQEAVGKKARGKTRGTIFLHLSIAASKGPRGEPTGVKNLPTEFLACSAGKWGFHQLREETREVHR